MLLLGFKLEALLLLILLILSTEEEAINFLYYSFNLGNYNFNLGSNAETVGYLLWFFVLDSASYALFFSISAIYSATNLLYYSCYFFISASVSFVFWGSWLAFSFFLCCCSSSFFSLILASILLSLSCISFMQFSS